MKLERKHWIGIIAVATTVGVGIYLYRRNKKIKEEKALQEAKSNETSSITRQPTAPTPAQVQNEVVEEDAPIKRLIPTFPLKNGSRGFEVAVVQEYMNSTCKESLKKAEMYPLDLTGDWDDEMDELCNMCASIKRDEIDESMYKRIHRDMKAANLLPQTKEAEG